jgi:hypothetical protein
MSLDTSSAPEAGKSAEAAEERFLDELRRRVAWQAEQAARQREAARPKDPLDTTVLWRLVEEHDDALRQSEWRAFLAELHELTDANGRLPASFERLVRTVFGELL